MKDFSPNTLNFLESLQEDTCQRNPTCSQETERDEAEASCTGLLLSAGFWFVLPINHSFPELSNLLTSVWTLVLSQSILSQSNITKIQQLKKEHCRSTEKSQLKNKQQNTAEKSTHLNRNSTSPSELFKNTASDEITKNSPVIFSQMLQILPKSCLKAWAHNAHRKPEQIKKILHLSVGKRS